MRKSKHAYVCVCEQGCMCWGEGGEKERKCVRESERQGKESMKRLRQRMRLSGNARL